MAVWKIGVAWVEHLRSDPIANFPIGVVAEKDMNKLHEPHPSLKSGLWEDSSSKMTQIQQGAMWVETSSKPHIEMHCEMPTSDVIVAKYPRLWSRNLISIMLKLAWVASQ